MRTSDLLGPKGGKGWRKKSIFKIQLNYWQNEVNCYKAEEELKMPCCF